MVEQSKFHEPRWSIGVIANATGTSANTLKSWVQRGLIVGKHNNIIEKQSRGLPTLYTTNAAFQIAIMALLVRDGIALSLASHAGRMFAHSGVGSLNWESDDTFVDDDPDRDPCGLFAQGETWLFVCPQTQKVQVVDDKRFLNALAEIQRPVGLASVTILPMSELYDLLPRRLFAANGMR
jgi:hypothetical protein